MVRWLKYSWVVWLLLLLLPGRSQAQTPISDDEVNAVARELFCPICESTPLDVCPTQACADWRELIRTQLSQGKSKQEILDYFADQYGDRVLAEPPRRGFDLLVWLLPLVAVIAGAVFFGRYLRSLQTPAGSPPTPPSPAPPANDYVARIEAELKQRDNK